MTTSVSDEKAVSANEPRSVSERLRIAVVSPEHWARVMGGAEYQVKLLIEGLTRELDAEVTYFAAHADAERDYATHRVVCVGRDGRLRRYGNFWDIFRLQRALQLFRPHVIYQRVGGAYTGISALYARRARVPLVWHVANEADCDSLPKLQTLFRRPHLYLDRLLLRFGARNAERIVVQSQTQARLLEANLNRASTMIRNFHPAPSEPDIDEKQLNVVWIANLKPLKRPNAFLEVAGHLEDLQHIRFIMVGRPYLRDSLQEQFEADLSTHKNVHYLGGKSQREVNRLLHESSLLVNTSRREGFPNVFIQAWMRGVPVLTLGVDPDGLLDGGALGRSCASAREIADQIRELSAHPGDLRKMGDRCREFALATFSMKNADDLVNLIVTTASNGLAERDKAKVAA